VRTIVARPQPFAKLLGRRLFRAGRPLRIDAELARKLGSSYELLVPFLERGSTTVVVPVATPGEVLGTLMLVSLDPARPLSDETVQTALAVAGQAALAIDNARLYQQQKDFTDTMQRSLLPRSAPELPGLELGAVYESSARVDVGGDVYDYLRLDDTRLAVVLGDVTGHGIEATADMAMAKFVFRSLAREHPEPADFLASANEVVVGEIAPGKFITMLYLTVDARRGEVACACAGHPPPRVVDPNGRVRELAVGGLALGIESGQVYDAVREPLPAGASVVLFTDGVIEARRDRELYGVERLDAVLARAAQLGAEELALAVLSDCRSFAGGELTDDCAVVVIRRLPDA
jgi:serine phosphatase RsbU (regulator of sigma subunit)